MKSYTQLLESINEMFPGSKEYIAKFGKAPLSQAAKDKEKESGTRVHKGSYGSGEDRPEPKDVESAPKRGRGRPPGKYGSYKTHAENKGKYKGVHAARKAKLKEALEYIDSLDESEIQAYIDSLDESTFADLQEFVEFNESAECDVDSYFDVIEECECEDEEQLDEISKTTLGSYIKKASHDVAARGAATRQFSIDARKAREDQDFTGARKKEAQADKTFAKSWKRREGMAKAVDRLTKEDVNESAVGIYTNFITEHKGN